MSYRIYLDDTIEIRDETPIFEFPVKKGTEEKEYPTHEVGKEEMWQILSFYRERLNQVAKEHHDDIENRKDTRMFWYIVKEYFDGNDFETMKDSSSFFLQYFYLLDIYKTNDRDNNKLLITHG